MSLRESKYVAELFVAKYAKKSLVCRAGWMMMEEDKNLLIRLLSKL